MAPAKTKGEVKDKGKKPKETPAVGKAEGPADLAEMARQMKAEVAEMSRRLEAKRKRTLILRGNSHNGKD